MASLTIRKLDDAIRDELRLRAARNGRSVEDEVRVILRDASQAPRGPPRHRLQPSCMSRPHRCGRPTAPRLNSPCHPDHRRRHRAYKALDLIRR